MRALCSPLNACGAGCRRYGVTVNRFASSALVASGNEPMLSTSMVMPALYLEDLLRRLVQAFARPVGLDQIVVADHREDRIVLVARMHREIHALFDHHGFVGANERPLHQVVALPVRVEAKLRRQSAAAHIVVVL